MKNYNYLDISDNLFGFDNPVANVAVPANKSVLNVEMKTEDDAWYILNKFSKVSTGRFAVLIHDSDGLNYMNIPVEGDIVFGTNLFPTEIAFPIVQHPNSRLYFDFYDLSGNPNTITVNPMGYKHLDKARPPVVGLKDPVTKALRGTRDHWKIYASQFNIIPFDEPENPLTIEDGADFIAVNKRAFASAPGGLSSFQATVKSRSVAWSRSPVRGDTGWGNSLLAVPITPALKIKRNADMSFKVKNLDAGPANNQVQLALEGLRRFG